MANYTLRPSIISLLCLITLLTSCTKKPTGSITVTTKSVTDVTENSAKTGGSVTCTGYAIGECGVCYGENSNPTVSDSFTKDHDGSGSFTSALSSLKSGTKYYVRAYAKTSSGIEYGSEKNFTTNKGYTINVFANPTAGGTVLGAGTYQQDQTCTVTAMAKSCYSFINWAENGSVVSSNASYTFTVTDSRTLVARFNSNSTGGSVPIGAIDGKFTINAAGDQVYFSKGNLQYIGSAATPYWKFADYQWEYFDDNSQHNNNPNIDRDLFGWGTSGYNHGAVAYQPWSMSTTYSDYYAYDSMTYNLYDSTGQADWGYNAISNGGNAANAWRTLTGDSNGEWYYIFHMRNTPSGIRYAKARVNNENGVILLPDNWNANYYRLNSTNTSGADYRNNIISASQWTTLEQRGAVFLPAAGRHFSGDDYEYGYYWSASCCDKISAYNVYFSVSTLTAGSGSGMNGHLYRDGRRSVRLVCPAD